MDMIEFLKSGAIISLTSDHLLVGWGKTRKKDNLNPAFYFSEFFLNGNSPWIQYSNWEEISVGDFKKQLRITSLGTCDWTIEHPERFKYTFDELSQLFQKNLLKKAVPYVFAVSQQQMTISRLQNCLNRALDMIGQNAGYLYGYWNEKKGILGITPEYLFIHSQLEPKKVYTMALAGTHPPYQNQQSFLRNEKEQYEHQLVVEGICQSLESLGIVTIGNTRLHKLPKLTHLMTPIEVDLNHSFHFDFLVEKLHPTPALGAFPKEKGKKWLEEYQIHTPREYYGAPIGFIYPQKGISKCLVGIRNVQWNTSNMRIGAGCGVVRQSSFEKEWQEIHFKIRSIRDCLYL